MHASTLVYLNYDIDPSRRPAMLGRLERELSPLGYRVATELTAEHCAAVGLLVNKTRELADEDLQRFPNLQGIILWGTQKWMLQIGMGDLFLFDESVYHHVEATKRGHGRNRGRWSVLIGARAPRDSTMRALYKRLRHGPLLRPVRRVLNRLLKKPQPAHAAG